MIKTPVQQAISEIEKLKANNRNIIANGNLNKQVKEIYENRQSAYNTSLNILQSLLPVEQQMMEKYYNQGHGDGKENMDKDFKDFKNCQRLFTKQNEPNGK